MFTMDNRSKRIVYLSHCLINSNTMAQGLGHVKMFPSLVNPLMELLQKLEVGIVQLPCPEKKILGLVRQPRNKDEFPTEETIKYVDEIVNTVCKEIIEYQDNGFKVIAIVGKRGSPVCAVKECWVSAGVLEPIPGFLMESFKRELRKNNLDVALLDFEKDEVTKSLLEIENVISKAKV